MVHRQPTSLRSMGKPASRLGDQRGRGIDGLVGWLAFHLDTCSTPAPLAGFAVMGFAIISRCRVASCRLNFAWCRCSYSNARMSHKSSACRWNRKHPARRSRRNELTGICKALFCNWTARRCRTQRQTLTFRESFIANPIAKWMGRTNAAPGKGYKRGPLVQVPMCLQQDQTHAVLPAGIGLPKRR